MGGSCQGSRAWSWDGRVGCHLLKEGQVIVYWHFVGGLRIVNDDHRDSNVLLAFLGRRRVRPQFGLLLTNGTRGLTFLDKHVVSATKVATYFADRVFFNGLRSFRYDVWNDLRVNSRYAGANVRVSCNQVVLHQDARRAFPFGRRLVVAICHAN